MEWKIFNPQKQIKHTDFVPDQRLLIDCQRQLAITLVSFTSLCGWFKRIYLKPTATAERIFPPAFGASQSRILSLRFY